MRLSKESIEELKNIYYQEYGEQISNEEAQVIGESLLSLFKIIYRPIPKNSKEKPPGQNEQKLS